jgi:hypothetical protein
MTRAVTAADEHDSKEGHDDDRLGPESCATKRRKEEKRRKEGAVD